MSALIHPTAIIDSSAELDSTVSVGPYAIIGPHVYIGPHTRIDAHVVVHQHTRIGSHNHLHSFASIGGDPQDKKYRGEEVWLEIGDHNIIREYCSLNRGTIQGGVLTRIGSHNWIMAQVHIAHDCILGDHLVLANGTGLAGHVHVGNHVILGGFTLIHQFCVVGDSAMTAYASGISRDVPPYTMVSGHRARPYGINIEGLRRRGFSAESIDRIKEAYALLYRQGLLFEEAKQRILNGSYPEWDVFRSFFARTSRGIVRP